MKRIACLGTLIAAPGKRNGTLPSSIIIEFYNDIRNFGRERELNHTFVLSQQSFLLIIEGEAQDLASLIRLLNSDSRAIDVSVIMHQSIENRMIAPSSMRVIRPGSDLTEGMRDRITLLLGDKIDTKKSFDQRRLNQLLATPASAESTSFPRR